jgi:hypothetical protein
MDDSVLATHAFSPRAPCLGNWLHREENEIAGILGLPVREIITPSFFRVIGEPESVAVQLEIFSRNCHSEAQRSAEQV